jgi:hypothetical protein
LGPQRLEEGKELALLHHKDGGCIILKVDGLPRHQERVVALVQNQFGPRPSPLVLVRTAAWSYWFMPVRTVKGIVAIAVDVSILAVR